MTEELNSGQPRTNPASGQSEPGTSRFQVWHSITTGHAAKILILHVKQVRNEMCDAVNQIITTDLFQENVL